MLLDFLDFFFRSISQSVLENIRTQGTLCLFISFLVRVRNFFCKKKKKKLEKGCDNSHVNNNNKNK